MLAVNYSTELSLFLRIATVPALIMICEFQSMRERNALNEQPLCLASVMRWAIVGYYLQDMCC